MPLNIWPTEQPKEESQEQPVEAQLAQDIVQVEDDSPAGGMRTKDKIAILAIIISLISLVGVGWDTFYSEPTPEPIQIVEPSTGGVTAQGFDIWPPVVGWAQIIDTAVHVCPEGCVYDTIQAAVDAADSGDTILIHAGPDNYIEDLTIDKNLSLMAVWQSTDQYIQSPAQVVIEGTVTIDPSDNTIMVWRGIQIRASGAGTTFALKTEGAAVPNLWLLDCYIYASDASGTGTDTVKAVWLTGATNVLMDMGTRLFGDTDGAGQDAYGALTTNTSGRIDTYLTVISGDGAAAGTGYGLGTSATGGLIVVHENSHGSNHSDYFLDCPSGATKCYLFGMVHTEKPLVEEGAIIVADGWAGSLLAPEEFYAQRNVKEKTGNYTLPVWETRTLYTNEGAAGNVTFTLPGAAAGVEYCFYVYAAQNVYVDPAAGDQIHHLTNAAGDRILSSTAGDSVCLVGADTTYWLPLQEVGTWTDAN